MMHLFAAKTIRIPAGRRRRASAPALPPPGRIKTLSRASPVRGKVRLPHTAGIHAFRREAGGERAAYAARRAGHHGHAATEILHGRRRVVVIARFVPR
jgi:hypothetical protein